MAISNINSLSLDPSGGFPASATATVATSQSTSSTSYTDLATVGPAVTITTGTKALVITTCYASNSTSTRSANWSFAVSGATTVAASDSWSGDIDNGPEGGRLSIAYLITGLTAGSNTFTTKYRVAIGTGTYQLRDILAIDMGS